jgi:hypothetical protein
VTAGQIEDEPDYIRLLSEMCDDFDLFQQRENFTLNSHVRDPAQFMFVYGLNCHAHYMVRRCLPILADSTIAVVPTLRSVYECGVMAQWLRWVPGSEVSFLEESRRQMAALAEDLNPRGATSSREGARRFLAELLLPEEPRAHSAKFHAICKAFHGGADLYGYYRVLSGHTHAGFQLAHAWLLFDETGPQVLDEPRGLPVWVVGYFALLALGWSARAFDDLVADSPRSDFLDAVEQLRRSTLDYESDFE